MEQFLKILGGLITSVVESDVAIAYWKLIFQMSTFKASLLVAAIGTFVTFIEFRIGRSDWLRKALKKVPRGASILLGAILPLSWIFPTFSFFWRVKKKVYSLTRFLKIMLGKMNNSVQPKTTNGAVKSIKGQLTALFKLALKKIMKSEYGVFFSTLVPPSLGGGFFRYSTIFMIISKKSLRLELIFYVVNISRIMGVGWIINRMIF